MSKSIELKLDVSFIPALPFMPKGEITGAVGIPFRNESYKFTG